MNRNAVLTLLICVNLILLTGVVFVTASPRVATAQPTGLAGNYLTVTGEIQEEFDALYLIDLSERTLHAFYFRKGTNDLQYAGYRNLELDFRHNRG
jgi:hypothetical protein